MSIEAECDRLSTVPLLKNIDLAKRKLIAMSSDHLEYATGDPVFLQGDAAQAVYILLSGSVRVVKDDGTHAVELAHIDRSAILGETGVVCGRHHAASVYATTETSMLRIDGRVFMELLHQIPDFAVGLLREMADRLESANEKLLHARTT